MTGEYTSNQRKYDSDIETDVSTGGETYTSSTDNSIQTRAVRPLVTDGGEENAKVVGESEETDGTGVLGRATEEGETYGVRGEVESTDGYGFYTPDDARIGGTVTGDTHWTVEIADEDDSDRAGAVVAGHPDNEANDAAGATVSGGGRSGSENTVSGNYGTVSGGKGNEASGEGAAILGGVNNYAAGDSSIAAGRTANATHDGAVVFGDSSESEIWSQGADEVRSQMPMYAPEFNTTSASAAKTAVESVDAEKVLEAVESLSLNTWEFNDDEGVRHMGPMAEEFFDEFGLGSTAEAIATVDADGVALAAIQGLARRLETENDRIREQMAEKDEQINALEATVDSLQAQLSKLETNEE